MPTGVYERTEEARKNISKAREGFKHTKESKKKMSEKAKERFLNKENHPMYGRCGELHPAWKGGFSRKEYKKKWREENKEHLKEYQNKNKEHKKEYYKQWCKDNPEKCKESGRRRRARELNAEGSFTEKEFKTILQFYHYRCCSCGTDLTKTDYHRDHIQPLSKGGSDFIKNIQPLCAYCNLSKNTKHRDYRDYWLRNYAI